MPSSDLYDRSVDSIIAVRVTLDSGSGRYFLTWGDLESNRSWPGDIERAVLRASRGFALRGTPVAARVCDSLQDASGERYFYESLFAMQHQMPAIAARRFTAWADAKTAAVLRGEELYYLGLPKDQDHTSPADPDARFGFTLGCVDHNGSLVAEYPLDGLPPEAAQQLLADEDIDRVMCLAHEVSGPTLAAIAAGRAIPVDEAAYKYVLSPWADAGYRTPAGYFPPPRLLPPFSDAQKVRPSSAAPKNARPDRVPRTTVTCGPPAGAGGVADRDMARSLLEQKTGMLGPPSGPRRP